MSKACFVIDLISKRGSIAVAGSCGKPGSSSYPNAASSHEHEDNAGAALPGQLLGPAGSQRRPWAQQQQDGSRATRRAFWPLASRH